MASAVRVTLAFTLAGGFVPSNPVEAQNSTGLECEGSLTLAIRANDPVLSGYGRSRRIHFEADFEGVLYLWTSPNELDLVLRVEDGTGKVVEDDDSGGSSTPCVALEVKRRARLVVQVAAKDSAATGALELCARCAPESPETRAAAEELRGAIELALADVADGRIAEARQLLASVVAETLEIPGARASARVVAALWSLGYEDAALLMETKKSAWGAVRELYERVLPPDHRELQAARVGFANTLAGLGRLEEARALQERALEIYSRTLTPDDPYLQNARLSLATTSVQLGNHQMAQGLQEKALAVLRATRPRDDLEFAKAWTSLGLTARELGDNPAARDAFEEAILVMSRTLPGDHLDLQNARINLAGTLYLLGENAKAVALYEQCLEVLGSTQPADHTALQMARQGLAVTLIQLGDFPRACELEEKVVEVLSRTLPETNPQLLLAQYNLAGMAYLAGDLQRARRMGEQVLQTQLKTLPEDSLDVQLSRVGLAGTLKALGELHAARVLEEKAFEVLSCKVPADNPYLLKTRQNLALTLSSLGDLRGARALLEGTLEGFSRTRSATDFDLQTARMNLAGVLQQLDELDGARELLEEVLRTGAGALPDDNQVLLDARTNLALILRDAGDLAGAREIQEELVEVLSKDSPEENYGLVSARLNLAGTLLMTGKPAEARPIGERVLEVLSRTRPRSDPDLLVAQRNLLCNLLLLRDQEGARRMSLEIAQGLEQILAEAGGHSASEFEGRITSVWPEVSAFLWSASGAGVLPPDPELERRGFTLVESMRSMALVEARLLASLEHGADLERLRAQRRSASQELARRNQGNEGRDRIQEALFALDRVTREISALLNASPGARELLVEPTLEALSREVRDDEALIAFCQVTRWQIEESSLRNAVGQRHLLAFVLRSGGKLTRLELGRMKPIEEAVRRWKEILLTADEKIAANSGGRRAWEAVLDEAGEAVRGLVFDPLAKSLSGTRTLVVALDDVLHTVPLDALPLEGGLVGDRFSIRVRSSLRELMWHEREPPRADSLIAFGGIDYDQPPEPLGGAGEVDVVQAAAPRHGAPAPGGAPASVLRAGEGPGFLRPLDASPYEVRGIERLYRERFGDDAGVRRLEGRYASRAALEELGPTARWLHLATHGWFASDSVRSSADSATQDARAGFRGLTAEEQIEGCSPMLLCGLALAGANRGETNLFGQVAGTITAEELATLDLSNCELAVLSACDTNVGVRRAGQGVASLQKALHMAGARSVITSLWKVPDVASRRLMESLYRRLWIEGKSKSQALWEAKMELRAERDAEGNPRFSARDWAGWMLTGEPN